MNTTGFFLKRQALRVEQISSIQDELLKVATLLEDGILFNDLDTCWNHHKKTNRQGASRIYNAFKHLQSIKALATSPEIHDVLARDCSIKVPALVDINWRIDSIGEEKYVFDWHQDYWFSVCSRKAVVLWIPLTEVTPQTGGLLLISNNVTGGRVFKTKRNQQQYNSYADAVLIDEEIKDLPFEKIDTMSAGDVLCFSFDVLHRSLPVISEIKSRFTVQLRFADFADVEFINNEYKPGIVNKNTVDYIKGKDQ
jgi:hypothetical protein